MSSLMSLLPPSTNQAAPSYQLLIPTTQPVPYLATPLAKPFGLAHTAGVLLYYYLRAGALVADPLSTLVQDLVAVTALQAVFCAACLPSAGNWYSGTGTAGRGGKILDGTATQSKGGAKRRTGVAGKAVAASKTTSDLSTTGGSVQSKVMPTVLSSILTLTVPPTPLAILALVLGAPLYPTYLLPHTFVLALHVSVLAFLPIFYTHGVSATAWRDVAAAWLPFDEAGVWGGAVGSLVGGWIGAIPMALDWDREWQKWPCTVVWGAVLGWGVGRVLTSALQLGIGKRINLSEANHPAASVIVESNDMALEKKSK